jgi:threonine aldolase
VNRIIDLRSDTFSLPDEGMRRAIRDAEVGNSGFREDPSVRKLEEECAAFFGLEAAVFLPSGTMAGQIALNIRSRPGDLVAIEENGHNLRFEAGSMALISGTQALTVRGDRGILDPARVRSAVVSAREHGARISCIVLENTSNFGGGTIYPRATLDDLFRLSGELGIPVHVDGARIWNAVAASGEDPASLVPEGGSVSACLSKGLGAPMGSILAGSEGFVEEARRVQQLLGGVMRQVGFMAAAGLYALRNNLGRLREDHARCRRMAERLADCPGVEIDLEAVQTNILYLRIRAGEEAAEDLRTRMAREGVLAFRVGDRIRLVTYLNVDDGDCDRAATVIAGHLRERSA